MLQQVLRKLVLTEVSLLTFFSIAGCAYFVFTFPLNGVQLHATLLTSSWELFLLGLPVLIAQPLFRRRFGKTIARIQAGDTLGVEEAGRFLRKVLAYPLQVSLTCALANVLGVGLMAMQVRHFAALPWEGVVIAVLCGLITGLLWGTVEYFAVEQIVRPLTSLVPAPPGFGATTPRVSLTVKIFVSSLVLVCATLGVFAVTAYTRAARIVEAQVGERLHSIVQEIANLTAELPPTETGELSDVWWSLVTEYRASPRGYIHLIDRTGKLLRTHPATEALGRHDLEEEGFLPEITHEILHAREGFTVDRVNEPKVIAYTFVPDSDWRLVAISPRSDFSIYLDHFLRSGLMAMGFSALLVFAVALLSARSVTTSLARVTSAAQSVAGQRALGQRVDFLTNDEVGVLALAFNEMASTIQSYAEGLEQIVAQRTRQLEQRGEQLEQKNAEMRDFLYVVSHDLRAPLINLEGFSRALEENLANLGEVMDRVVHGQTTEGVEIGDEWSNAKEEIGESIGFILRSVSKMDMLAKALLELSRIETRPHLPQRIETRKMVEEIAGTLRYQADQRGIDINLLDLPDIVGDSVRINQVFTNLIDNAIKYMKANGEKRIDVGFEEDAETFNFFVRDTGPGIRPEDQSKVFRLFTRLVTGTVPGDGVGLAAVRKIVEKHGGRIWVESVLGEGSTFWFAIPKPKPSELDRSDERDVGTGTDHDSDG